MKIKRKIVPGGFLYIVEGSKGHLSSSFVSVRSSLSTKSKSQADLILDLLVINGDMTPDAISKTLEIELTRARQLCSKLKARGLVKKVGICYGLNG